MKCPHCDKEFPLMLCPECRGETLEKSRYCCWCGSPMMMEEGDADFSQRKLCSDGTCIGVINEEGVCNICRKPYNEETV